MNSTDLRHLIDRLREYAAFGRQTQELTYGAQVTQMPDDLALAATLLEAALEAAVFIDADELPVQGSRPS